MARTQNAPVRLWRWIAQRLMILSLAGVAVGCVDETFLFVGSHSLSFSEGEGTQQIQVLSNKDFRATSGASWCRVTTKKEDAAPGSFALSVTCEANSSYEERSCTISISCGGHVEIIEVKQSAQSRLVISKEQKEFHLDAAGCNITVDCQANIPISYGIDVSWISLVSTKGLNSQSYTFSVSSNSSAEARSGRIRFYNTAKGVNEEVWVYQTQNNAITLSASQFYVSAEGTTIQVDVSANVDYRVSVTEGSTWISESSTKGMTAQTRVFEIKPNTSYDDREGRIRFYNESLDLSQEVIVHQYQKNAIIISKKEYDVSADGETIEVAVQSNISVSVEIADGSSWIKWISIKGLSTNMYTFSIEANTSADSRTGHIRFYNTTTNQSDVVEIRQPQKSALEVSPKEFNVGPDGEIIYIDVKSNVDIKASIVQGSAWISSVSTKGMTTQTWSFAVKANSTYDDREGRIRFYNSSQNLSEEVVVRQSASGAIKIDKKLYEVSYESQSLDIAVLTNIEYTVQINADCQSWIKKVETKGLETTLFTLQIEENEQKEREGIVYVSTATDVITLRIKQADGSIYFPDEFFREFCIQEFDSNKDGVVSYKEARAVDGMYVETDNIRSLSGIEFFTNISWLSCHGGINGIDPCGKLESLDVSKNTLLTYLYCFGNQLTSLDVSKNTDLVYLYCPYNRLTSLDVSKNTALIDLKCSANQLMSLDLCNNPVLSSLECYDNSLKYLDISKNTELTKLWCWYNYLTNLDVSKSIGLTELKCYHNQLSSLDVSKNTGLANLICGDNQLTNLDVSKNTGLTELECYHNQLSSLDVSKNTALTDLRCSNNQLTSLDVSKNTALLWLMCEDNKLTVLDISKNLSLENLFCYNTTMTDLYMSKSQSESIIKSVYSGTTVHHL